MMWRTTVRGNPGALYAGEKRSWIPGRSGGRVVLKAAGARRRQSDTPSQSVGGCRR